METTLEIYIEQPVKYFIRHIFNCRLGPDPGVVDQDIDFAVLLYGDPDEVLAIDPRAHIRFNGKAFTPELFYFGPHLFGLGFVGIIIYGNIGPEPREQYGRGRTYTARAAGYESYFTIESYHN